MRFISVLSGLLVFMSIASPEIYASYQEVAVTDGGSITGKVIYNGTVKQRTVLPTKDKNVCGSARKEPVIIVGEGGAVAASVVY